MITRGTSLYVRRITLLNIAHGPKAPSGDLDSVLVLNASWLGGTEWGSVRCIRWMHTESEWTCAVTVNLVGDSEGGGGLGDRGGHHGLEDYNLSVGRRCFNRSGDWIIEDVPGGNERISGERLGYLRRRLHYRFSFKRSGLLEE